MLRIFSMAVDGFAAPGLDLHDAYILSRDHHDSCYPRAVLEKSCRRFIPKP